MPKYSAATINHMGEHVTFAVAMSYQDEIELLDGIGITVLPGPQVHIPPELHMLWVGNSICCVGRPDGSYKVQPQHQPAFVKTLYTWALW